MSEERNAIPLIITGVCSIIGTALEHAVDLHAQVLRRTQGNGPVAQALLRARPALSPHGADDAADTRNDQGDGVAFFTHCWLSGSSSVFVEAG